MIVTQGQAAESNIQERHSFSIKANAKAFKLLSSNLYSDKPLAIVRELGCNALDSHVAAGKADTPFKIVLPSDMHPWLEIIDYGTGLNDDQVKNIFTTYFESTKTTSNDYIGAMGLGSKSPFAYTDAFEVFARQGGIQNTYTCFLNKSGAPEIFMLETQKDDPAMGIKFEDGVTIKVPVKQNDYQLFRTAAQKAYKFFKVKPVVGANTRNWEWEEPEYGYTGTNFKVLKNMRQCFALMGPVAYPLDLNQFKSDGFMAKHMANGSGGFLIDFGIGKLDVNAGREGLSYDEDTIANIEAGIANIRAEMATELQAKIEECPNMYQAIIFRRKFDSNDMFRLTYKGVVVSTYLTYNFQDADQKPAWAIKQRSERYIERLKDITRIHDITIVPDKNARFVLIDDRTKYVKKIRFSDENMSNTTFVLGLDAAVEGKAQFAELIKKFEADGTPYKFISEVEDKIPTITRTKADPSAAVDKSKIKYSGFYKYHKAYGVLAVSTHTNLNGLEMEADSLYIKWDTTAKRYNINGYICPADEISGVIWKIINEIITETGKPLVIATHKVYDKIPKNWVDISTLIPAKIATTMSLKTFKDSHPGFISTVVDFDSKTYDQIMAEPKVNPVFKELFDSIRALQFGTAYDYTTTQFVKRVFSLTSETNPLRYILSFSEALFANYFMAQSARRYYSSSWPEKDFKECLILFSAMINYGMIDENKLKDILKNK